MVAELCVVSSTQFHDWLFLILAKAAEGSVSEDKRPGIAMCFLGTGSGSIARPSALLQAKNENNLAPSWKPSGPKAGCINGIGGIAREPLRG